jgi:hypothetical protein
MRKVVLQPLMLAMVLAFGFMAICVAVDSWIISSYREDAVGAGENLGFLPDGTALIASHPGGSQGGPHFRDLQGNPVTLSVDDMHATLNGCLLAANLPQGSDDLSWDDRSSQLADGRMPPTTWYFLSDGRREGAGHFVGYDSNSKVRIGYLGTAGFCKGSLPAEEWFPFGGTTNPFINSRLVVGSGRYSMYSDGLGSGYHSVGPSRGRAPQGFLNEWDVYIFGRDGKIYHADLQARTVHVVLENPQLRSVTTSAWSEDANRGLLWRLAARTDDAILVLNVQGKPLARYAIPEAVRNLDFTFAESKAGEAVLYWSSPEDSLATEKEYRIFWVKPDGQCREAAVTLAHRGELRPMRVYAGVTMPSPLGLSCSYMRGRFQELLNHGLSATPAEALSRAFAEFWPALAIAQTIAFALAMLCYRRQVRYGVSRTERIVWPLFVLLFGLPGWIGYRFGRSWPVLETCPDCGANVPRDRESCLRCTNDFPRPALKGTEVFA